MEIIMGVAAILAVAIFLGKKYFDNKAARGARPPARGKDNEDRERDSNGMPDI